MKNIFRLFIAAVFFACFFIKASFANVNTVQKTVNILTWWGYLNDPNMIKSAEKTCHVNISFDQYYSNEEFIRRWREQKSTYNILIFSNTIYKGIKNEIIKIVNSNLWELSNYYNPIIKSHYLNSGYPKNVVYFMHSLTGFVYNPDKILISKSDSILELFRKAENKIIFIIDDPVEEKIFLSQSSQNWKNFNGNITSDKFKKIFQNSIVYVSNEFNQAYKSKKFAFSFTWSGGGIKNIEEAGVNLKFLIHPKLSYISSDLLAQVKPDKKTECVASYLASREIAKNIENREYYFSPYADINGIKNKNFLMIYKQFLKLLPELHWIESVSESDFQELNRSWEMVKMNIFQGGSDDRK